jgi:hypothetical protein
MNNFVATLSTSCPQCENPLVRRFTFLHHPALLAVELWQDLRSFDPVLEIDVDGVRRQYSLRGVIYFAGAHFTARVITHTGMVWYHDGIFTGSSLVYESADISLATTENAITAIYVRV